MLHNLKRYYGIVWRPLDRDFATQDMQRTISRDTRPRVYGAIGQCEFKSIITQTGSISKHEASEISSKFLVVWPTNQVIVVRYLPALLAFWVMSVVGGIEPPLP